MSPLVSPCLSTSLGSTPVPSESHLLSLALFTVSLTYVPAHPHSPHPPQLRSSQTGLYLRTGLYRFPEQNHR